MIKRNKKLLAGLSDDQRPIFIDPHIVKLLSHLQPTANSSILCALVLQKISWVIHRQKKAKSIKTSIPKLHKAHFAYMSEKRVREAIRMLHEVGILKIETSSGAHDSKFYLDRGRVVKLAKMVQAEYEIEAQLNETCEMIQRTNGYAEWFEGKTAFLSVVFSWQLPEALQRAAWLKASGYYVRAGGPAVSINPVYLSNVAEVGGEVKALQYHNQNATFTTRGCIRACPFCAVPRIEGKLRELPDNEWEPMPIICDNNLLAASTKHFNHVMDRLGESKITGIDFNQGLDVRLLTQNHAGRLSELHKTKQLKMVRLAWDYIKTEKSFRRVFDLLRNNGIPAKKISVYVLIGFDDTPDDALYRLSEVWKLKAWPNPMRYQPLNTLSRNAYVGTNWTHYELQRYVRYWSNLRHLSGIPFDEFKA